MILEDLGPRGKMFEDLEVGDYVFEITKPKEWTSTFADKDNEKATATSINWTLRVLSPEESEGRLFFHRTQYKVSPEKMAKAARPYKADGFTRQFWVAIGAAFMEGNESILFDQFTDENGQVDLNAFMGLRFNGSLRMVPDKKDSSKSYLNLTNAWID